MPGPLLKPQPLPESIDPQNASVFDPLYKTLLRKATSMVGLDDPVNSVMTAASPAVMVAGVSPDKIPYLKQAGRALLDRVKSEGVYEHIAGGAKVPSTPPTKLPSYVVDSLEYAQKKYPRLFGHLTDIRDIDMIQKLNQEGTGNVTLGSQLPVNQATAKGKFSILELNPTYATPHTVGHELYHVADQLTRPDKFREMYNFANTLPGGYSANSHEILANIQGDKFQNAFTKQSEKVTPDVIDWILNKVGLGKK